MSGLYYLGHHFFNSRLLIFLALYASFSNPDQNKPLKNFKGLMIALIIFLGISILFLFIFEKNAINFVFPSLPNDHGKTILYYVDLLRLFNLELLWTLLLLLIALILTVWFRASYIFRYVDLALVQHNRWFLGVIILIFTCVVLVASFIALQQFPNSSDEYVYLYQAETLSEGKLWEKAHPVEKSFGFNHMVTKNDITLGRFPSGWPLILSGFLVLGIPAALVNPILAILTLLVFYKLANNLYGNRVACWSVLTLACTGFFVFNSASFFSHTSCLLNALLCVLLINLYLKNDKVKYVLLAGLSLGIIMLIRSYTAVLLFIPFFIVIFYQHRLRALKHFVLLGVGALPCLLFFLWYNYTITGNPLEPVTVWAYQNEGLGFVNGHTVLNGLEHVTRRFLMFCYWCSPVFLIFYFYFLWQKVKNKNERLTHPEDYFFIVFIIGYFFYYEIGGNQYGPRFYFEAFPFMIVFVVNKVFELDNYFVKAFFYAALVIMVMKLPFIAYRENKIITERKDVYTLVEQNKLTNAVVLLTSGTGVMRPMPIGDLTRNDHNYMNDVLFAINDERYNAELMKYYSDRIFYKYVRKPENVKGELLRISP